MNDAQVAKVAYEADRALAQTHGEPTGKPFEELTQTERDALAAKVEAALNGKRRGVTPTVVARRAAGIHASQRAHLFCAIVHAFAQHDQDVNTPPPQLPQTQDPTLRALQLTDEELPANVPQHGTTPDQSAQLEGGTDEVYEPEDVTDNPELAAHEG